MKELKVGDLVVSKIDGIGKVISVSSQDSIIYPVQVVFLKKEREMVLLK